MSQLSFSIPGSDGIRFRSLGAAPAVLSTDVARHFQRRHSHVLREIDRLRSILPKSFTEPNFGRSDYVDGTGRKLPAFLLTRDALSLLVMGFTGKAAVLWKLRYIEAFNAMEDNLRRMAALERPVPRALPQAERQETARLVWKLGPAKKRRLRAVLRYRNMGLGVHSIAKLLDCHGREVSTLLKAADALGWLPPAAPRPVQGNLLEVGHEQ